MDQLKNNNESPTFRLPEVQIDTNESNNAFEAVAKSINEQDMSKAVEQNSINNSAVSNPVITSPIPTTPFQQPINPISIQQQQTKQIPVTDGLPAADVDLIEKAWIVKAKAIVEQTKNDPYVQTNELKKIRNDYQSKRFKTNPKIDNE